MPQVLPPGSRPRVDEPSSIATALAFRRRQGCQDGFHRAFQSDVYGGALLRRHVDHVLGIGRSRFAITVLRVWQQHGFILPKDRPGVWWLAPMLRVRQEAEAVDVDHGRIGPGSEGL